MIVEHEIKRHPLFIYPPPKSKSLSSSKHESFKISTAEVDPEFLLNYKPETVVVPEFEELIQKVFVMFFFHSLYS